MKKINREKVGLHPVMTYIIIAAAIVILSTVFYMLNFQATYNEISSITGEYKVTTEAVKPLFNLSGLKFIFTSTVSSFSKFVVLPYLIIILLGIGVMEKSGFLKTIITLMTKKSRKITVTYGLVLTCLIAGIIGDLSYIIFIPLSALLFKYGKRNPIIGIITAFSALTCGNAINIFYTSVDSSLSTITMNNANVYLSSFNINIFSFILIKIVITLILSFVITYVVEKMIVRKIPKYEFEEDDLEEELLFTKRKKKGLVFAGLAAVIYLITFIYNIIPGLPLSGKMLDYTQTLYIDKLFSYNSFFSSGFIFIVSVFFIVIGLSYGIGAKTIKNNKDFIESLGYSLNDIGKILVMIFAASALINIYKQSNIGNFIAVSFANIIDNLNFLGLPLLILIFVVSAIVTIFLPNTINKWTILSSTIVPKVIDSGLSPALAQVIYRLGGVVTLSLTPVFAYFIVYIAFMDKYNQNKNFKLSGAIKYQLVFSGILFVVFLAIIIIWYLIGLPIGINSGISL